MYICRTVSKKNRPDNPSRTESGKWTTGCGETFDSCIDPTQNVGKVYSHSHWLRRRYRARLLFEQVLDAMLWLAVPQTKN